MSKNPAFKYYIFDLDGTLTDSSIPIGRGLVAALNSVGINGIKPEDTYHWIGRPLKEIYEWYLREKLDRELDDKTMDEMVQAYRVGHDVCFEQETKIYPNVVETIRWIRANGSKAAVATTKYQEAAEYCLNTLHLFEELDAVCGTEPEEPVKPDPLVINKAIKALGANPEETIVIGDTLGDLGAGRAAGCKVGIVGYGFGDNDQLRKAKPDFWLNDLKELV